MWTILLLLFTPRLVYGDTSVLILARGGSKGILLKNLKTVGNVTLLTRAIQTSKLAGLNVTVSTDHFLIALEDGAAVFRRSKVASTDWAPSIWGAAEFVASRPKIETLILLQATSPFIQSVHLRKALAKLEKYDCVFSVSRSFKLRWSETNGIIRPLNFEPHSRPRRQDWNGELIETGGFYVARTHLIKKGVFQSENCTVVEVSDTNTLEIDTYHDLQVANALHRANLA